MLVGTAAWLTNISSLFPFFLVCFVLLEEIRVQKRSDKSFGRDETRPQ